MSNKTLKNASFDYNQVEFTKISLHDEERWNNQPDALKTFDNNGKTLYFNMKPYFMVDVNPYSSSQKEWYHSNTPMFRHNFECDVITVTLRYYPEKLVYNTKGDGFNLDVQPYLPETNSIIVFKNGRKLSSDEFKEMGPRLLRMKDYVHVTDEISIQYKPATLNEIYFEYINSNIIRFKSDTIFTNFIITDMQVWGWRINQEALNPLKFIDKHTHTTIKNIQLWHPLHGYPFVEAKKNIDLMSIGDPAMYSMSLLDNKIPYPEARNHDNRIDGFQPWREERIGTTWLDTNHLHYKRYSDVQAFPDYEDRMRKWGELADFGEIIVREWVQSNVSPEIWDELAEIEEIDDNIIESEKKSGRVWFPLFERIEEPGVQLEEQKWRLFEKQYEEFDVAIDATIFEMGDSIEEPKKEPKESTETVELFLEDSGPIKEIESEDIEENDEMIFQDYKEAEAAPTSTNPPSFSTGAASAYLNKTGYMLKVQQTFTYWAPEQKKQISWGQIKSFQEFRDRHKPGITPFWSNYQITMANQIAYNGGKWPRFPPNGRGNAIIWPGSQKVIQDYRTTTYSKLGIYEWPRASNWVKIPSGEYDGWYHPPGNAPGVTSSTTHSVVKVTDPHEGGTEVIPPEERGPISGINPSGTDIWRPPAKPQPEYTGGTSTHETDGGSSGGSTGTGTGTIKTGIQKYNGGIILLSNKGGIRIEKDGNLYTTYNGGLTWGFCQLKTGSVTYDDEINNRIYDEIQNDEIIFQDYEEAEDGTVRRLLPPNYRCTYASPGYSWPAKAGKWPAHIGPPPSQKDCVSAAQAECPRYETIKPPTTSGGSGTQTSGGSGTQTSGGSGTQTSGGSSETETIKYYNGGVILIGDDGGFKVDRDGNLYTTNDGGVNWKRSYCTRTGSTETNDSVFLISDMGGFKVDRYGNLYTTNNGGVTWKNCYIGESYDEIENDEMIFQDYEDEDSFLDQFNKAANAQNTEFTEAEQIKLSEEHMKRINEEMRREIEEAGKAKPGEEPTFEQFLAKFNEEVLAQNTESGSGSTGSLTPDPRYSNDPPLYNWESATAYLRKIGGDSLIERMQRAFNYMDPDSETNPRWDGTEPFETFLSRYGSRCTDNWRNYKMTIANQAAYNKWKTGNADITDLDRSSRGNAVAWPGRVSGGWDYRWTFPESKRGAGGGNENMIAYYEWPRSDKWIQVPDSSGDTHHGSFGGYFHSPGKTPKPADDSEPQLSGEPPIGLHNPGGSFKGYTSGTETHAGQGGGTSVGPGPGPSSGGTSVGPGPGPGTGSTGTGTTGTGTTGTTGKRFEYSNDSVILIGEIGGIKVNHNGDLYTTNDGGITWKFCCEGPGHLREIDQVLLPYEIFGTWGCRPQMPRNIPSQKEKNIDPNSFYPPGTISHTFKTNFRNADDLRAIVNVYVNGELFMHDIFIPEDGVLSFFNLKEADKVHFVRIPTEDEELIEELIEEGKLIRHYQYTQTTYFNDIGEKKLYYYFWVRNKLTKPNIKDRTIASAFIERELNNTDNPFFIFQNPLPPKWIHYKHDWKEIPWRMNKLIVKGLRGLVDANKRYVIQFTRDFTLRNKLDYGQTPLELKNLHEQWKLIRKEQKSIIDKYLWDKITESIIEHKIGDKSTPIPSYERELYDLKYNTETKYGLEEGQAFANKNLAKETVLNYLKNNNNNFVPVDIHRFFEKHSFDTDRNVIKAMDTIYGTFSFEHVNNIWFSVLYDSMANKHEYPGIMKTSMIAIHSVVILDDQGKFDD